MRPRDFSNDYCGDCRIKEKADFIQTGCLYTVASRLPFSPSPRFAPAQKSERELSPGPLRQTRPPSTHFSRGSLLTCDLDHVDGGTIGNMKAFLKGAPRAHLVPRAPASLRSGRCAPDCDPPPSDAKDASSCRHLYLRLGTTTFNLTRQRPPNSTSTDRLQTVPRKTSTIARQGYLSLRQAAGYQLECPHRRQASLWPAKLAESVRKGKHCPGRLAKFPEGLAGCHVEQSDNKTPACSRPSLPLLLSLSAVSGAANTVS